MKTEIFEKELTKLLAYQAMQERQLNVASELTAIDIYVGDVQRSKTLHENNVYTASRRMRIKIQ